MLANEASWTRYDQLEVIRHVPYVDGCLELPTAQGIGVELDRERVARYAEVYRTDATAFGFHDSRALSATPGPAQILKAVQPRTNRTWRIARLSSPPERRKGGCPVRLAQLRPRTQNAGSLAHLR